MLPQEGVLVGPRHMVAVDVPTLFVWTKLLFTLRNTCAEHLVCAN
jgi:hypothetical protein